MIETPLLQGNIARNCHPLGCRAQLHHQANYILSQKPFSGAKRVLVIGGSSGFGLASRLALMLAGNADTISIAYERGPSERGVGTAGWYNAVFFKELAESRGRVGTNIIGDAFTPETRKSAIAAIKRDLGGEIDLLIYSLATGRRTTANGQWNSVLKTTGAPLTGYSINLETQQLVEETVPVATDEEIAATVKVMGGEDWSQWIEELSQAGVLARGFQTLAFSYIGPELTAPIYQNGSIGAAKRHLHQSADVLNSQLRSLTGGQAHVCVAKALVTKASVYIPVMSPYIALLYQVMKEQGVHEECIEQMYRLFSERLYADADAGPVTDERRLIRLDDWELSEAVQSQICKRLPLVTPSNFKDTTDYQGYRAAFLRLNGFDVPGINYQEPLSIESLIRMMP
jgi:enoyl-[acyl-carrier protein] reductase/trans-2-enoyl-CoA reductase (NAD+)